jgi:hypothetical protein
LGFPTGRSSTRHQAIFLVLLSEIKEEEAPTSTTHQQFFWGRCHGERGFLQGESLASNLLLCYCFALFYFFLHLFIKNTKKNSSFIVVIFTCLLCSLARISNPEVEVRTFKQQGGESLKDSWY